MKGSQSWGVFSMLLQCIAWQAVGCWQWQKHKARLTLQSLTSDLDVILGHTRNVSLNLEAGVGLQ